MPKLAIRAYAHLRFAELRSFLSAHYGSNWVDKVSAATHIRPPLLWDMFTEKHAAGGRPTHCEHVRFINASRVEQLAKSLGWKSRMMVKFAKTREDLSNATLQDLHEGRAP